MKLSALHPRYEAGKRARVLADLEPKLLALAQLAMAQGIALTVDIFNLFNFQKATAVDQRYTPAAVAPITSGGLANLTNADGSAFDPATVNPNFGKALAYQAPRIFRFGLKGTF